MFIESVGDQCSLELLQRRQREAREAVRLHVLRSLRGHRRPGSSSNIQSADANNIGLYFELDAILAVVSAGRAHVWRQIFALRQHRRRGGHLGLHHRRVHPRRPGKCAAGRQGASGAARDPAATRTTRSGPAAIRAEGTRSVAQEIRLSRRRRVRSWPDIRSPGRAVPACGMARCSPRSPCSS